MRGGQGGGEFQIGVSLKERMKEFSEGMVKREKKFPRIQGG